MADRDEITRFLDSYLKTDAIADHAINGMQAEGRARVKKIVFGVSASLALFERAAARGADMIVVHHGLLWSKQQALKGVFGRRAEYLLRNGITLLAYHLPLDMHKTSGNNIQLIKWLGAQKVKPFGRYDGNFIGYEGIFAGPKPLSEISAVLAKKLSAEPVCLAHGRNPVRSLGVVSGGAGGLMAEAAEKRLDLFVTGEIGEPAPEFCREARLNLIGLGHYNSEKPGVLALSGLISEKFSVSTEFIDVPNRF